MHPRSCVYAFCCRCSVHVSNSEIYPTHIHNSNNNSSTARTHNEFYIHIVAKLSNIYNFVVFSFPFIFRSTSC